VTNDKVMCDVLSLSCFIFGLVGTPRNSQPWKWCCGVFVDPYRYVFFLHGGFKVINTNHVPKSDSKEEWIVRRNLMLSEFTLQLLIIVPVT
jgi:hypothetical protein